MIEWIKSHLVEDVKDAWRWFSVQSMGIVTIMLGAWAALPDDLKMYIPERLGIALAGGILALGILGRLVKQK